MDLYARLRGDQALCGVAVYRHHFSATGGYAYLHRPVPILYFTREDSARPSVDLMQTADAFNTIMTSPTHAAELPSPFKTLGCEGRGADRVCLYRRPGPCTATGGAFAMSEVLRRLDE
jgi:hypothetical protein